MPARNVPAFVPPRFPTVMETSICPPGGAETGPVTEVTTRSGSPEVAPRVIVTVCPATRTVPDRSPPPFAAAVKDTVPLPLPCALPPIVIHATLLAADHAQPAGAVTPIDPVPPVASKNCSRPAIV